MKRVGTFYVKNSKASLNKQNDAFSKVIQDHDEWDLVQEYIGYDRTILAKRMTDDILSKSFDILLVYEFGAFANKNNFISNIVKDYRIEIWSVTEGKLDTSKHTLEELIWEE